MNLKLHHELLQHYRLSHQSTANINFDSERMTIEIDDVNRFEINSHRSVHFRILVDTTNIFILNDFIDVT